MNKVVIKIKSYSSNLIMKLASFNVNILRIKEEKGYYILEILQEDLTKIPKYYEYQIIKADVKTRVKNFLWLNKYNALIFLVFLLFFIFVTNLTMEVKVIHNDKDLRNLILEELENYHIKRFSFKKSYDYLTKVKNNILEKYKEKIEWLEIERVGLDYEVKVTERIIPLPKEDTGLCNIIAKKEGIITKIRNTKGEALVHDSSHVNKGDILISGTISFNEQDKGYTCAEGKVYAEVWYTVDVEIPMYEEEKVYTGKMRYNLKYSRGNIDYPIFRSRLDKYEVEDYKIISLFGNQFYLQKEIEYVIKRKNLNEEEALKKADSLIAEKVNLKLEENESILYKKVLKKSVSSSKMVIEAFVATEEQIGESSPFTIPKENTPEGE